MSKYKIQEPKKTGSQFFFSGQTTRASAPPSNPYGSEALRCLLQVVRPQEGEPMLLLWAVPGWTPRAKPQLPGTLPQTPPPRRGYLSNPLLVPWSLCNFTHPRGVWMALFLFFLNICFHCQTNRPRAMWACSTIILSALRVRLSIKPASVYNSQLEVNTKTRSQHHYHKLIVYHVDSQEGSALNC